MQMDNEWVLAKMDERFGRYSPRVLTKLRAYAMACPQCEVVPGCMCVGSWWLFRWNKSHPHEARLVAAICKFGAPTHPDEAATWT